jgi:DNA-binding transcriptional LysR family regulator
MKTEQKNVYLWMMIFNEVVEQGSFTRAAEKLHLTKSGVSQHVSKLEKHLGVQLLIRSTRSLSLTETGKQLFQRSAELKILLDISIDEVTSLNHQPTGSLSITAPQALISPAVLPAIKQLIKQFPGIKPRLIVDDGNQDIIKKGIDVAIRVGSLQDSDLKARKIGGHREIFVASSAYVSSLNKQITQQDVHTHPFIATSWQSTDLDHQLIDRNKEHHNVFLQPSFEVNTANTAIELVLLDLGVALLPDIYVDSFIRAGKIQRVLRHLQTDVNDIYYVHAYKSTVPLKIKWFLEFLVKWL